MNKSFLITLMIYFTISRLMEKRINSHSYNFNSFSLSFLFLFFLSLSSTPSLLSFYQNLSTLLYNKGVTLYQINKKAFQTVEKIMNENEDIKIVIDILLQGLALCERKIEVCYISKYYLSFFFLFNYFFFLFIIY